MKKYRIVLKNETEIEVIGKINFSIDNTGKRISYIGIEQVKEGTPNPLFINTDEIIALIESELY